VLLVPSPNGPPGPIVDDQCTSQVSVTVVGKQASAWAPPRGVCPADECTGVHPQAGGSCASTG
jgi:hypothetical protein